VNRDPIGEIGGINLKQAFRNRPVAIWDGLGLSCQSVVDDGFSTPGEREILEVMSHSRCSVNMSCTCCDCKKGARGWTENPPVVVKAWGNRYVFIYIKLCSNCDNSDAQLISFRRHELSHARDLCLGASLPCGNRTIGSNGKLELL